MMDSFLNAIRSEAQATRQTRELIKETAAEADSSFAKVLDNAQGVMGVSLPARSRMLGQAKTSMRTLEAIEVRKTARACAPIEEEPEYNPPREPKHVTFEPMAVIAAKLKETLRNRR
jgi:hypothetical protein